MSDLLTPLTSVIGHHLIILQVVIPLVAAPVCALLTSPRYSWGLAQFIGLISLCVSIYLLLVVLDNGPVSYALGGWAAPWGIEYRLDSVNAFLLLLLCGINVVTLTFARTSVSREIEADKIPLFYSCWLLCFTGLAGITVTADVFNVFVFLEISSLSSYALIAMGSDRRALMASFQYLILGTIGATFIVISIGLLYMLTGTLNMADLYQRLPSLYDSRTLQGALIFFLAGIGLKIALFPLHSWLPNAYSYAPSSVAAFLSGTATKVAVYVLLRFCFGIFGAAYVFGFFHFQWLLLALAVIAIYYGSIVALRQTNIRRLLAFSSVAQIGYMIVGVCLLNLAGLTGGLLHLFNHGLMKTGLFMAVGCMSYRAGSAEIQHLAGIGKHMPWTSAAFLVCAASLVGIPLTAGFVSKWYLIVGSLQNDWWWLGVLLLLGSVVTLVYIWKFIELAYFQPPSEAMSEVREAPLGLLLPTWFLALANLYFGIETSLPVNVAKQAAQTLLDLDV